MTKPKTSSGFSTLNLEETINAILNFIDRDREKEVVSRRFGLFDRKETLEQIGELLGITRERVRQLEKAIVTKLKNAAKEGKLESLQAAQENILEIIKTNGSVMRISQLADLLTKDGTKIDQARLSFIAELAPQLANIEESDHYFASTAERELYDEKTIREQANKIVDIIRKKIARPCDISEVAELYGSDDVTHIEAVASISKDLAHLNGKWGYIKWPTVNPKNIRDKIYVILSEKGSHMHFNEIAAAIRESDFKRKDVTTQAIHNELIKDKRFVLIGRGIYALDEWGYKKGTVADIISDVLKKAGEPLHRDEIVKRVLKTRHVKETTILLNLQGKDQFKRVAKATYTLAEA
jgi:hypothetical protein